MNRLVKFESHFDRKAILLNILFAINYYDVNKLHQIIQNTSPKDIAFAISFMNQEHLYSLVRMMDGNINIEIINILEPDLKLDLLEKIDEYKNSGNIKTHQIDREILTQKALSVLVEAINKNDSHKVIKIFDSMQHSDAATLIELLKPKQRYVLLELLGNNFNSEIFTYLDSAITSQLLAKIDQKVLSIYISQMEPQDMVEVLEHMDLKQRVNTINSLSRLISKDDLRFLKKNLNYKENTAGRMMRNVIVMPGSATVQSAYKRYCFYSKTSDSNQVIYICDSESKIKPPGKIYLSDLCRLNQRRQTRLDNLSKHAQLAPFVVFVDTDISEIIFLVKKYYTIDMPVLTANYRIVGSINSDQVISIFEAVENQTMMTLGRVSKFDFHSSIASTVMKRISSLILATVLCIGSATLIYAFEETVQMIFPLVMLSPIIAGVGGNTASQVMTVTVRALFSGEIAGSNKMSAIMKEVVVCFVCGLSLGFFMFFLSLLIWGSKLFSAIVLSSVMLILSIAGFVGSGIPIILSRWKKDPASSSTVMNVVTDVCSYIIFFGTAWFFRERLLRELVAAKTHIAPEQKKVFRSEKVLAEPRKTTIN